MQACARIGADPFGRVRRLLRRRRQATESRTAGREVVITADGGWRARQRRRAQEGGRRGARGRVSDACRSVDRPRSAPASTSRCGRAATLVARPGRGTAARPCEPEWVEAEHPLFMLYTSGSTGKPKGIHAHHRRLPARREAHVASGFSTCDDDVFWCTADIGWVTGHTYIVYGPLCAGATSRHVRGRAELPGPRPLVGHHREVRRQRSSTPRRPPSACSCKLATSGWRSTTCRSLRLLGSVGEPINPDAWMWYYEHVGKGRCPIVDTWWQTETGGIMICRRSRRRCRRPSPAPPAARCPASSPTVVNESGEPVPAGRTAAYLVLKKPYPGMLRTTSTRTAALQGRLLGALPPATT